MSQPWTSLYRPVTREDFVGNPSAVKEIEAWLKQWKSGKLSKFKALFLYGPPGIGKTSVVQVLAYEYDFDLIEINASDARNKNSLEEVLGKAIKQNVTLFGQLRLILLDEMDGLSGTNDRGGVSSIAKAIDESTSPIILVANTIKENMGERFSSILNKSKNVVFKPLTFQDVYTRLERIAQEQGIKVEAEVIDMIAMKSDGDLRSAIMDFETVSCGKNLVSISDLNVLSQRDRQDETPAILNRIFSATNLSDARQTIRQSMISYDDLFDWIYENLPTVIDDPHERLQALNQLSKADIYQTKAKQYDYRLLKYMFDLMTGGIAFSRCSSQGIGYTEQLNVAVLKAGLPPSSLQSRETSDGVEIKPTKEPGSNTWNKLNTELKKIGANWVYGKNVWVLPYYKEPQTKWRYIRTYHSRRRLDSVAEQIAYHCHTSKNRVKNEILLILSYMIQHDERFYNDTRRWMTDLPDKKLDYLRLLSFEKGPDDFVSLENYAKYKQRETQKMIEQIASDKESNLKNIERWLDDQKKAASWR